MKLQFSIVFVFIFQIAFSQDPVFRDEDYYKSEIERNIFRGTITFQAPAEIIFSICYEHELIKPFTLVIKAGPSIYTNNPEPESEIELTAKASGELRYYFNLKRRIKNNKTTRNFSGGYVSLEPFVRSKALVLFKDPYHEERPPATGVNVNIGFQQQKRRNYVSGFVGMRFGARDNSESDVFDILMVGLVIGRVF